MLKNIEICFAAEDVLSIRSWIYGFNLEYRRYQMGVESELEEMLLSFRELCEDKYESVSCLQFGEQYFETIQCDIDAVDKVARVKDYTAAYDIINGKILPNTIKLLNLIFQQYGDEISKYFWENNKAALEERYPEVAKKMEQLLKDERIGVREYGSRGKVVYKKNGKAEYDLYSAYHPFDIGERMTEMFPAEPHSKIYVWGSNGGFELDGLMHNLYGNVIMEVYVNDLLEFMCILLNTKRNGNILRSKFHWHFEVGVEEFLQDFSADTEKGKKYLYVSRFCDEGRKAITEFVISHSLNSNVGGVL